MGLRTRALHDGKFEAPHIYSRSTKLRTGINKLLERYFGKKQTQLIQNNLIVEKEKKQSTTCYSDG